MRVLHRPGEHWPSMIAPLLVLGGACEPQNCPPPVVTGVTPAVLSSASGGDITIRGGNFCMTVRVDFESEGVEVAGLFEAALVGSNEEPAPFALANLYWQDAGSITAHVPAGASPGLHSLQLTIPDGRTATLEDAVTLVDRVIGAECTVDGDCSDDPCATGLSCVEGQCMYDYDRDVDGDGSVDAACGGMDCDDTDSSVYHGSACDDREACTEGDLCNAGVCTGFRTSGCGDCSIACSAPCAAGECCAAVCVAGSCPNCAADCSCDLACLGLSNCALQCDPGSVCRFTTTAHPEHTDLTCTDATCTLRCTRTGKHCRMSCIGDAVCIMECEGVARNCVTTCEDQSVCVMTCNANSGNCQLIAEDTASGLIECIDVEGSCLPDCASPTTCSATLTACNRPCPH